MMSILNCLSVYIQQTASSQVHLPGVEHFSYNAKRIPLFYHSVRTCPLAIAAKSSRYDEQYYTA